MSNRTALEVGAELLAEDATNGDVPPPDPANMPRAAGLALIYTGPNEEGTHGQRALFVRHAERDIWEFPGGGIEPGETAEAAAVREVTEEIGATPSGRISLMLRDSMTGVDYSTFIAHADEMITPRLSDELTDWQWAPITAPPEPLHAGVRMALARLNMNELDVARAIVNGSLSSPQQFENLWLYALRITGTGISFRPELDEYVWRDPSIYLNAEFLARCNGLTVIWKHPPGDALDQSEFEDRVLGSIMLPYLVQDEVWGIAKIYDQDAAQMMLDKKLSTSSAVVWRDPGANETRRVDSGRTLLIEGEPSLLDHLAICELGVWDKGGEPTGVAKGEPRMAEEKAPADEKAEPSVSEQLKTIGDAVSRMCDRMDAFEAKHAKKDDDKDKDAKKDDAEEEDEDKKSAADASKKDGDLKQWAEEEEKEPEHKKDAKRKDDDDDRRGRHAAEEGERGGEKGKPAEMADDDKKGKHDRKDDDDRRGKHDDDKRGKHDDDDRGRHARKDAATESRLAALERQARRPGPTDEELNLLAASQHEWDQVAQAHGERTSRPMAGETADSYGRRLASRYKKHSSQWAKVDLSTLPAEVLNIALPAIRADAVSAAYRSDGGAAGVLREIQKPDRTGRIISEFVGPVSATLAPFRMPVSRVKRINTQPGQY